MRSAIHVNNELIEGGVWQQGEQYNDTRKDGQEETERHGVGPGNQRLLLKFTVNEYQQIMYGYATQTGQRMSLRPLCYAVQ